jgi:hypothetical protein
VGSQSLNGAVQPGNIQTLSLGRVSLKPGGAEFRLMAAQGNKTGELMKPRSLVLKTVSK